MVAKSKLNTNDVSIHYFNEPDKVKRQVNVPQKLDIEIENDGSLSQAFGSGFFDEADKIANERNETYKNI